MAKPDWLMTIQEAHKEYNSLINQMGVKNEQLDLCKYGAVGTQAFDAEFDASNWHIYLLI